MNAQQKRKATEAARRVVAHYAACRDLVGRWVEKDAITLADYVLALRDARGRMAQFVKPLRNNHTMREWLVIESSMKNGIFVPPELKDMKGYIPRDVAEAICSRSMAGPQWFTREESEKMRAHPEWRDTEPPHGMSPEHRVEETK